MCNPKVQARLLNEGGTELNFIVGLCVGHDMLFTMESKVPVSSIITKDRVLANNPAGAVYSRYWRRKLGILEERHCIRKYFFMKVCRSCGRLFYCKAANGREFPFRLLEKLM